ncbi:MAG: hypothetical protein HYY04_00850 [Chloroflexi bacterium]|nr:hypothetical protein [Chloroflexota bacterium]
MLHGLPIPGRIQPTAREVYRAQVGNHLDWRFPMRKYEKGLDRPGILVCPRCHAISEQKRWYIDEARYRELRTVPGVRFITCPGCQRIDRQLYGGEVHLRSPLLAANKEQALGLIYHEEDRARQSNPFARLASVVDRGEELEILTTTPFLAERIGKAFRKTFKGELELEHLPYEKFIRVRWSR